MSFSKQLFTPKETELRDSHVILEHFHNVATQVDRISLSFLGKVIQGNFGFPQRFRSIIPIINIAAPPPPTHTKIHIQYHGMGACWSFEAILDSVAKEGTWLLRIPHQITKNSARRVHRFILNAQQSWIFHSSQALGRFSLRDLSTMGCSLYVATPALTLTPNERLRGIIEFHTKLSIPVCVQVRHISGMHNDPTTKIAGCSFEEISDWSRIQIDEQLQQLPNSDIRRI